MCFLPPTKHLTAGRCHPAPRRPWTTASSPWKTSQTTHPTLARLNFPRPRTGDGPFLHFFLRFASLKESSETLRSRGGEKKCSNAACVVWRCVAGPRPSQRLRTFRGHPPMPAASPAWWRKTRERRTMTQDRWVETRKGVTIKIVDGLGRILGKASFGFHPHVCSFLQLVWHYF